MFRPESLWAILDGTGWRCEAVTKLAIPSGVGRVEFLVAIRRARYYESKYWEQAADRACNHPSAADQAAEKLENLGEIGGKRATGPRGRIDPLPYAGDKSPAYLKTEFFRSL